MLIAGLTEMRNDKIEQLRRQCTNLNDKIKEVSYAVRVTFLTVSHQVMSEALQYSVGVQYQTANKKASVLHQVCNN